MSESTISQRRLWLAVNSHGWEDFPVHHQGEQAAELLASWGALWHPAVLKDSRNLPKWVRIDSLPDPAKGSIVVVPEFARTLVPDDLENRLTDLGGKYCFGNKSRLEIVQDILGDGGSFQTAFDPLVADDFFALGYCYLQVQLMTRQLRYVSTLDNAVLENKLFEAVDAATVGETGNCRELLQACFDQLLQERNRYYPTCASLIDCVYLTVETLGPELSRTLHQPNRMTIQAAGHVIEALAKTPGNAEIRQQIEDRVDAGRLSLAAGPWTELASPLLSVSTVVRQVVRGRIAARDTFPEATNLTFATRRFGLGRSLPGILKLAGYSSAIHATLDEGVFPQTTNNNMRWQGDDSKTIDALATPPRLADAPETWLGLGIRIGELVDSQHYGSVFVVHWPGQKCDSYMDLVNSSRFGDILGRFVTIDDYFEQVSDPGFSQNYRADDYRNPYLSQFVAAEQVDPISRFVRYWQRTVRLLSLEGLTAMKRVLANSKAVQGESDLESIGIAIDQLTEVDQGSDLEAEHDLGGKSVQSSELGTGLLKLLYGNRDDETMAGEKGKLVINSLGFSRKRFDSGHSAVIPAFGFTWVPDSKPATVPSKKRLLKRTKSARMVLEENSLQNEFFILDVNDVTGGIKAIQLHNQRGSLVSQRLAIRKSANAVSRGGKKEGRYTKMVADTTCIVEDSEWCAAIESTGRLVLDSRDVATFRQRLRIERGSPLVELDISIELSESIAGSPWENYLASRIAWKNEAAELFTWLHETRQPTSRNRIVAPMALEIDQQPKRICLLPGGLPFHQRVGYRQLDTLLATQGETTRSWSFCIGINVAYPIAAAMGAMCNPIVIPDVTPATGDPDTGWIFHLNCKNVAVVGWKTPNRNEESSLVMVRETEGRAAKVALDCARPIRKAWACDLMADRLHELVVSHGKAEWEMVAHELAQVELVW